MGFSRQEYWSGLPFLSPGNLPNPGIQPGSPALQADSLPTELQEKLGIWSKCHIHLHIQLPFPPSLACGLWRRWRGTAVSEVEGGGRARGPSHKEFTQPVPSPLIRALDREQDWLPGYFSLPVSSLEFLLGVCEFLHETHMGSLLKMQYLSPAADTLNHSLGKDLTWLHVSRHPGDCHTPWSLTNNLKAQILEEEFVLLLQKTH